MSTGTERDQFRPDPAYQRRIGQLVTMLDDGQVAVMLGQIADRWAQPDDAEEEAPRTQLYIKYTLEGLLKGPAVALADFLTFLDYCFGPGPGPVPGLLEPPARAR